MSAYVGLILIFIYAFFKFAWSYRLFNYVAILLGAMPPLSQRDTAEAGSPWVLLLTTALVVIVTWRRQFASNAWQAMES